MRFSKPLPVPDDGEGTVLTVRGVVEEVLEDGSIGVGLTATIGDGVKVLMGAKAVLRPA